MSNVTLYLSLCKDVVDRPLSRALRDRAAALSFGEGGFSYADTPAAEKPRFAAPQGAFFSVSHSENVFLCAVCDAEVGVDVQVPRAESGREETLAARFFSEEERASLAALRGQEEKYLFEFARIWTRHEAAAKYTGRGLSDVFARREEDVFYTDLTPLLLSLGIFAPATLVTADVPRIIPDFLED
ncbi:MAG: 4'-phosphopantetheinyl transferase superfamily protein [Clostridia bacterium]|nr:4'-phosphopantetheinyl transferase superfamily protein [Clostridia bacterium]